MFVQRPTSTLQRILNFLVILSIALCFISSLTPCVTAVRPRLHAIDVDAYCKRTVGHHAQAVALNMRDAMSWACFKHGAYYAVSMPDTCLMEYGPHYRAVLQDRHDAYSWGCQFAP